MASLISEPAPPGTIIEMTGIRKVYDTGKVKVEALKGLDLTVHRGELTAIVGPSGSGKSTLMNLIGCLDVPTSGRYLFADREVLGLTDDALSELRNSRIGFVFQSFYLLPYATVLENVLLPSLYRESTKDNARERALELLKLVGLEGRIRFRPNRLSGGEQQRVAICRALMNDPDLLLADEPTGQLDSRTAAEIMSLLVAMNQRGKTVIVVTHDAAIAAYTKRIIQIKDGVIVDEQAD
jgi:putative ABC transport system ATP-binding protein